NRVGLLEEWVRSLVWSGEEDDLWDVFRNPRQDGSKSCRRGSPDQEHRIDIVQGSVESVGDREVAADDLDLGGQIGGIRVASQGAAPDIRGDQLRDDVAPDGTSCSDDKDSFHTRLSSPKIPAPFLHNNGAAGALILLTVP